MDFLKINKIEKPDGLPDDEWLDLEVDRFEETGEDLVAFKKKHITFLRQTITSAEFKDLKITVEALEVKLNEKEKTDFWMDILSMLFSTAFTSLVKAIGEKWIKTLSSKLLNNQKDYQLMFSTETFKAAVLKTDAAEMLAFSKTTGMFFKEIVPTLGTVGKAVEGNAISSFTKFVQESQGELFRLVKSLVKQEKARPSDFFEYQKNLIFNEELNLPDMEKDMDRYIRKVKRKMYKIDSEDVSDLVGYLRNAMPIEVEDDSDLTNPDFRRLMVGLFLGYGVALGRNMILKNVLIDPVGEALNISGDVVAATNMTGLLAFFDFKVGDVETFSLINSTQALKLASNIPALEDQTVGKAEKNGHPLLKVKKGTFLGDYLVLEEKDLMFMLYDRKNPFFKYLFESYSDWTELQNLISYHDLAKEYVDENILRKSMNQDLPPNKELDEKVKKASEELGKIFREKYLPEVIESLIRPILLQYTKDFKKKRKAFGEIQEVAEAFQKAKRESLAAGE